MVRDTFAISLLRDFIREKLGGDIHKLRTYDLKILSDDQRYGDNIIERAPIVKAVMSLAFNDVWPELSVDKLNKGKFECDAINKYQNLFGINMCDQYFKGMQKFNPSSSLLQRALKVAHLTDSIGNLWVLPSSPFIASRILDNSYRYYMDKFLLSIYNVLTEKKRVDKTLQSIIAKNEQMAAYKGEEGFDRFIQGMMLDDFLDYSRKPAEVFSFVWSSMKDLDKETYFNAVDQYCTFCEKFIPKRADMIIEKLSIALSKTLLVQESVIEPLAEKEDTKPVENEQKEEPNILNRYTLAYQFITMSVEFAVEDIGVRLPLLADKEYYMTLAKKLGLRVKGFTWDELLITVENLEDDYIALFFVFPKPKKEPEALYGAILFNRRWSTLTYYTLEKCSHPGRWALGKNTSDLHALMGMYDMEPTKENFLKMIVPEEEQPINVDIRALLCLPERFKLLKNMPQDPAGCVSYGMSTPHCDAFIQAFPITYRKCMPFADTKAIINGIHKSLGDNQALIEVKNGCAKSSQPFVYSIVKTKMDPSGVDYFMLMHIAHKKGVISINAHFAENGMTGLRDATIWEVAVRKGVVSVENKDAWNFDPCDNNFKHPFLMNLSEKEEFDKAFPEHPLTQARQFVKLIADKL